MDRDFRLRRQSTLRGGLGDPRNAVEDVFAHLVLGRPHRDLQLYLVGDDVVLAAAVDRADRDHGRVGWVGLAADQRLQVENDPGRQDDRVYRSVRGRAVAALAL